MQELFITFPRQNNRQARADGRATIAKGKNMKELEISEKMLTANIVRELYPEPPKLE